MGRGAVARAGSGASGASRRRAGAGGTSRRASRARGASRRAVGARPACLAAPPPALTARPSGDFVRGLSEIESFELSIWDAFFIKSLNFIFLTAAGATGAGAGAVPRGGGAVRGARGARAAPAGGPRKGTVGASFFFAGAPMRARRACSLRSISALRAAFNRATTGSTGRLLVGADRTAGATDCAAGDAAAARAGGGAAPSARRAASVGTWPFRRTCSRMFESDMPSKVLGSRLLQIRASLHIRLRSRATSLV